MTLNKSVVDMDRMNFIHSSYENFTRELYQNGTRTGSVINITAMDNLTEQFELYLNKTTSETARYDNQRDPMGIIMPITVFYVIIFIAGLLGNVITCTVISRNKCMHTATNYYLFNLAISDLLLLLSGLPPDMYNMWYPVAYPFNHSVCVVQSLLAETSSNATVLTITSFTVERYIAICHPFRQHTMSKLSRAIKFIMAIWILAFCLAAPQAFQYTVIDYGGGQYLCTVDNNAADVVVQHAFQVSGFIFFVGPMTVICVLYVLIGIKLRKSKLLQGIKRKACDYGKNVSGQTRVIRMLVAVVVAFFICWAPFHAQRLMAVYGTMQNKPSELFDGIYHIINYGSGVLYFLSTCINPLLYSIMSHKFRDAFKSTLSRQCGFQKSYQQNNNHTYSALSRNGGGSIKMTANVNQRVNGIPDCGGIVPHDNLDDTDKIVSQPQTPKHRLLLKSPSRGGILVAANNSEYKPNNSISSQSTIFTTLSRTDGGAATGSDSVASTNERVPHAGKTLTTIAEKIRRGTKKVLHFKNPTSPTSDGGTGIGGGGNGLTRKGEKKLKKVNSNDSAHTNTISNSSLQELDEDEFTSSELARYMGEVNNEINRLDRNV